MVGCGRPYLIGCGRLKTTGRRRMKKLSASRRPFLALATLAIALTVSCRGPAGTDATADAPAEAAAGEGQSTYSMGIIYFAPEEGVDSVLRGLFEGLEAEGLKEGG